MEKVVECGRADTVDPSWWLLFAAKSLRLHPTLCNPINSPPGSLVPGILQARTLEWVAISFFNAWKWKVKVKSLSRVQLFETPWTAAYQAPPSIGFSRQEYWSEVSLPSCVQLFEIPWTVAQQASLSMDFPGKYTGEGCRFLLLEILLTRDQIQVSYVSCFGRQILNGWAIKEAPICRRNQYRIM